MAANIMCHSSVIAEIIYTGLVIANNSVYTIAYAYISLDIVLMIHRLQTFDVVTIEQ